MKIETICTPEGLVVREVEPNAGRAWLRIHSEGWSARTGDAPWVVVPISEVPASCLVEYCKFAAIRERVEKQL